MPRQQILLDERQLHFLISTRLSDTEAVRIRRTLKSRRFQSALLKSIRETLGQFQLLPSVRIRIG